MKKKLSNRLLSILLAVTLLVGLMTGCGKESKESSSAVSESSSKETTGAASENTEAGSAEESTEAAKGITYPIDTDVTLKIATFTNSAVTAHYESKQDTPFWEELQKRTGIKVELVELKKDAYKLLVSGGQIDDIDILWNQTAYLPASPEVCIQDKLIISLNDYLDEYLPDYKALLESNETLRRTATTAKGDVAGVFPTEEDEYLQCVSGMVVRWDWLEDLNMDVPETIDEFYDMLVAFRDKKGAEVPMSMTLGMLETKALYGGLTDAFGLATVNYYVEDGKVHFGYAEPELKDVYAFLNKLYNEGLLDPEFQTVNSATTTSNLLTGRSGVNAGAVGGGIGTWLNQMAETDPKFNLTGIPSLVAEKGQVARMNAGTALTPDTAPVACITATCKNPEIAAMFLNYGFTEEGINFWNFGIEGVSYNMVDGYPTYTDFIMKNPDGWSVQQAMAGYSHGYSMPLSIQQREYMEQYSALPGQKSALENWTKANLNDYLMPTVEYSESVSAERTALRSEINTYIRQMLVAYVNGSKSLDTFESEYLATLKALGVDRLLEIEQEAYDAYMAK